MNETYLLHFYVPMVIATGTLFCMMFKFIKEEIKNFINLNKDFDVHYE